MTTTKELAVNSVRPQLTLIPPDAEQFSVYGGADTTEAARQWAINGRYLLCDGLPRCAHGLYMMESCPAQCSRLRFHDHPNLWVSGDRSCGGAFLLTHPYAKTLDRAGRDYASSHGLDVMVDYPGDRWYGSGTIAVRMSVPPGWPMWPIEQEAAVLLASQPIEWQSLWSARW